MATLTDKQRSIVNHAKLTEQDGWHHLKVSGSPYEMGFQHGYLLAPQYQEALATYWAMTIECFGMEYSFFVDAAVRLHKDKIPPYLMEELQGLADGFTAAGVATTQDDLIGWNAWMELTDYWWPTVAAKYATNPPNGPRGSHCSGLVATGSATVDGKVVLAHESFDEFWAGQYFNVLLDMTPEDGNRIVMQTVAGYLASMTDYYVTSAGLAITETTLAGFKGYDESRVPEYVRARNAAQFASTIDEWVELMNKDSNGGYANTWLLADANTGEIARYEEGLVYQSLSRTKDGAYFGCNAAFDPRIRNLECADQGFNDPRQQTGARRQRFMELLEQYHGTIDVEVAKKILADTFDPYLGYQNPSSRGICSHYDVDPMYYADDPGGVWNVPFFPAGSVDGKAAGQDDILAMRMWGRIGRADGVEFDAEAFLRQHPLWNWQEGHLKSRPSQPWTLFT
ncbi:C45 family autoproteolytic acyltransferase/hydolase [Actinomyces minihominis]|uniref:C45 family autoproteolytic acyltransferase/hydolase n=1 Tax=Actinomyces minihominis TaxID=2002838 RepID=UPI000C08BF8A|nr:C45 family peptidase [Actinomyces minihominis]